MWTLRSKEVWLVVILVIVAFVVRAWHLPESMNFSTDQAVFGTRAWEIWQTKDLTFAGPTASISYQGRYLIQSSAIFYQTLLFLLPVNFEPVAASLLMSLVASLMILPLYYGVKNLAQPWAASVVAGLFALAPVYVEYSRFLWNPNFQLIYTPLLIFFISLYFKHRQLRWLTLSALTAGALLLYHYQFFLAIGGLTMVLFAKQRDVKSVAVWLAGLVIGAAPLLIFELTSGFYLTQTFSLLISHSNQLSSSEPTAFPTHYFLSLSLLLLTGCVVWLSKLYPLFWNRRNATMILVITALIALARFYPVPNKAYGMADNWNFDREAAVHNLIVQEKLDNYAVVNSIYETTASVQYYLLTTHQDQGWTKDYQTADYLFVIGTTGLSDPTNNAAYELNTFKPSSVIKTWQLSPTYSLYLLARSKSN